MGHNCLGRSPAPVDGADGWATMHVRIARKEPAGDPRQAMQRMLGVAGSGYTELASSIDLCPTCAKRMIAASGCEAKIATELPPPVEGTSAAGVVGLPYLL